MSRYFFFLNIDLLECRDIGILRYWFELNIDEDVFLSPTAIAGVFGLPGVPSLALPDVMGAVSTVGSPISSV